MFLHLLLIDLQAPRSVSELSTPVPPPDRQAGRQPAKGAGNVGGDGGRQAGRWKSEVSKNGRGGARLSEKVVGKFAKRVHRPTPGLFSCFVSAPALGEKYGSQCPGGFRV